MPECTNCLSNDLPLMSGLPSTSDVRGARSRSWKRHERSFLVDTALSYSLRNLSYIRDEHRGQPMKQQIVSLVTLGVLMALTGSEAAVDNVAQHDQVKTLPSGEAVLAADFGNEIKSSTKMPMYDAFRKFCLDTGVQSEAIEKTVAISGIRFHKRGPSSTTNPMPMDLTMWDMDFEGHKLTLNAGHSTEPYGQAMVRKSTTCSIVSWDKNEDASIAALFKWAGISPTADQRRRGVTFYEFEVRGSAMLPLKDDDAGRLARAGGRTWLLTIIRGAPTVTLAHYFPVAPRP